MYTCACICVGARGKLRLLVVFRLCDNRLYLLRHLIGQHSLPVHILDPLAWKRHMATDNQKICSGIRETPFKDLALPITILAMRQKFEECSKFNYVLSRFLTCWSSELFKSLTAVAKFKKRNVTLLSYLKNKYNL